MSNYLVTGANGFVGRPLVERLCAAGHQVRAVCREGGDPVGPKPGDLVSRVPAQTDFLKLAERWPEDRPCDVAIHLAARVHVMNEAKTSKPADILALYRETNVQGSLRVAQAAKQAGVRRFVFVSSVKAMGDQEPGWPPHPWRESDPPMPGDAYGVTKREAEVALSEFCARNGMGFMVIRPPLVYGPTVRANFRQLLSLVARRIPLPLGSVSARRSMVFVDNLVDAMLTLAEHPLAVGRCFNVSDGEDLTVARIADILGEAMACPVRLFNVPPAFLSMAARLAGRSEQADRLLQPLRVDIHALRTVVNWQPRHTAEEGLRRTAIWYRDVFLKNR